MADRQDVVVYADGGDMTVARTIPAYVLGAFDVVLPDGREQEKGDDRIRNGYIYRPPKPATGSLDVGFIKADVKLDLGAKTSSLERVVDSAIRRTEGDVFFERDISSSGLGGFIPGRDFDLHDVIRVDVWGKLLPSPVTAVDFEGSVSHHLGTRVHVGDQMLTDAEALQAKTDATLERLESERRQRLKELGAVGAKADRANENAKNAQGSADQAQETADEAIKKWREQKDALDKVQSAQIETNAKVNDAQQRAIDLGFLFNHGEWVMSKEWKANAGESKVMDFDTASSTPRGCESTVITTDGKPVGSGIKFLSPGYWRLYARVLIPWVGLIQSAEVNVSIVVMGKNGKRIAKARYDLVVDAAPGTASFPTTVEIPESGCYAYVEVRTNRALNQSIVPGTFVEPGNNEFSAQQISKIF